MCVVSKYNMIMTFQPFFFFIYPIIYIAVGEQFVEVFYAFHRFPVIIILKTLLNGAQVHWRLDNCIVILKTEKRTEKIIHKRS